MVNHFRSQSDFEHYLTTSQDGEISAHYGNLHLKSVYQPIYCRQKQIYGFEALMRGFNNEGEPVCPAFLFRNLSENDPDFEDQINIDRLMRVIHLRNFAHFKLECAIFLNMLPSTAVFSLQSFYSQKLMLDRLAALEISRSKVVLEIVEHCHNDLPSLISATSLSVEKGFSIAIDDYGTNGSSKERVKALQPHILKIDRSLLGLYMSGNTFELLDAIRLAKQVSAKVLVEGIETEEEYEAMTALEVDYFQGYYLGHPLPLTEYQAVFADLSSAKTPVKASNIPPTV